VSDTGACPPAEIEGSVPPASTEADPQLATPEPRQRPRRAALERAAIKISEQLKPKRGRRMNL
jgi:hypothetical protein